MTDAIVVFHAGSTSLKFGAYTADPAGSLPLLCRGRIDSMQGDPHFRDHLQFWEYFHGDSGRGVGANHQTGWTGLIAALLAPSSPPSNKF